MQSLSRYLVHLFSLNMLVLSCAVVRYDKKMKLCLTFLIIKKIEEWKRKKVEGALTKTSKYKADTTHFENAFFASKQSVMRVFPTPAASYLQDKSVPRRIINIKR